MLKSLDILGLRGFAMKQTLTFAVPTGEPGSGLTVIVGANNAGKSTAVEALRAVAQQQPPSFTQGRRNQVAGDRVEIRVVGHDDRAVTLRTIKPGSSQTEHVHDGKDIDLRRLLVLPARRGFNPYFGRSEVTRDNYMNTLGFPAIRTSSLDQFAYRLFTVEKNRAAFDALLKRVVDPVPEWSIDQMDSGEYFLKVRKGDATHSSEGLGDGLVSLLYIIDALYDSKEGDVIAIDEPELSLHPALQRKLAHLLVEFSANRQIIISTHSPYFVPLDALPAGATVARIQSVTEQSRICQLSSTTAKTIFGLLKNDNNPHIFGLLAQEIVFIEDRVVLVEGQEDVVFFRRVEADVQQLNGTFFGWGVGGAENMERVATVLRELGFKKVVGILDGNKADLVGVLTVEFPEYHFLAIPANSVRTKSAIAEKPAVPGLLDDDNKSVRPQHVDQIRQLFTDANAYFRK